MTYFGQLFEGEERDAYQSLVMSMGLIGGAFGSLIVMPFSNNPKNGANYFDAMWLALGATAIALLMVTIFLVPPEHKERKEEAEAQEEVKTPALAKRILTIAVIASALDSGGDEGTRMARGTILSTVFPEWQTTEKQNYLILGTLLMVIVSLVLLMVLRQRGFNLGSICVFGSICTFAVQLMLLVEWDVGPFIGIWASGKIFGFLSTIGAGFVISEIAPKERLGFWNGLNSGCSNLAQAIAPLVFATVYDAIGNARGQEMLMCTSVISLLAVVAYSPLIALIPKPAKEVPMEMQDLEMYEKMSDTEWSQLPAAIIDQVTAELVKAGKTPRVASWGNYQSERPLLTDLQSRARGDFKYFSQHMVQLLSNRQKLIEEQQNWNKYMEVVPKVDRDRVKLEMGAWIADYFDDAGYTDWEIQSQTYKAMIMTAFPPINALDGVKPNFNTMSTDQMEVVMTKVLGVMDSYLATEERRLRGLNQSSFSTLIRRRA